MYNKEKICRASTVLTSVTAHKVIIDMISMAFFFCYLLFHLPSAKISTGQSSLPHGMMQIFINKVSDSAIVVSFLVCMLCKFSTYSPSHAIV